MMSPPNMMMPNEEMRPHSVAFGTPMYPMMNFQWKPLHSNPPPDVTTGGAPLGASQPNFSGLLFRPDVISDQPVSCRNKILLCRKKNPTNLEYLSSFSSSSWDILVLCQ